MALFEIKSSRAIRSSTSLEDLIVRKKRYIPSGSKLLHKTESGFLILHRYNHPKGVNKLEE